MENVIEITRAGYVSLFLCALAYASVCAYHYFKTGRTYFTDQEKTIGKIHVILSLIRMLGVPLSLLLVIVGAFELVL